jgi:pyruvate carboxylase
MKQGYIHLLPQILRFLENTRQIVRYHDVTPGSQITWNTAFLAVTGAWKRGGGEEAEKLLRILEQVVATPEHALDQDMKRERLAIYRDCNDAFRNLLLGKFGKLPLGFPPDWVYESAFGPAFRQALAERTEDCPLDHLPPVDIEREAKACAEIIKHPPNREELVLYLNHPGDAVKTIQFINQFGNPNNLPLHVWFEGLKHGQELQYADSDGKPHQMTIFSVSPVSNQGTVVMRLNYDSEFVSHEIKVAEPTTGGQPGVAMADPANPYHVAAPSNGDLWVMYVRPGDIVKAGKELFNISIMKQEKAVLSPVDGVVKRVLKSANYKVTRSMTPVREGELIVELASLPQLCSNPDCTKPLPSMALNYCPWCGCKLAEPISSPKE